MFKKSPIIAYPYKTKAKLNMIIPIQTTIPPVFKIILMATITNDFTTNLLPFSLHPLKIDIIKYTKGMHPAKIKNTPITFPIFPPAASVKKLKFFILYHIQAIYFQLHFLIILNRYVQYNE